MENNNQNVKDDMVVSMTYVLQVDGEELDRADDDEPMMFLQGHGNIIPGLEQALYGLDIGETKEVAIKPEDGYGVRDSKGTEELPKNMLPEDYDPIVGDPLHLRDTETDDVFQVFVTEVADDGIVVDFNHPLAGKTLHFKVKIVDLREATAEELAHGHVHGEHGHHH